MHTLIHFLLFSFSLKVWCQNHTNDSLLKISPPSSCPFTTLEKSPHSSDLSVLTPNEDRVSFNKATLLFKGERKLKNRRYIFSFYSPVPLLVQAIIIFLHLTAASRLDKCPELLQQGYFTHSSRLYAQCNLSKTKCSICFFSI